MSKIELSYFAQSSNDNIINRTAEVNILSLRFLKKHQSFFNVSILAQAI